MKNSSLLIRTGIIVVVTLIALFMVFGPRQSFTTDAFTWNGIKHNLAENINLGLDLQGGSHFVMRVRTEEYLKRLTDNNREAAFNAAKAENLPVTNSSDVVETRNYSVTLQTSDPARNQEIIQAVNKKVNFTNEGWNQSTSGSDITWTLPIQAQTTLGRSAVDQALRIIEGRINSFGVKEPTLQRIGSESSGQILLQMPGVEDPERIKKLIGAESRLDLMKVVSPPNPAPLQTYTSQQEAIQSLGGTVPQNRKVLKYSDRDETTVAGQPPTPPRWVVVEYPAIVDGNELRDASAVSRTGNESDYQISFSLKPAGAVTFGDWTAKNINGYMAVVLNEEVKSAAYISSQITDSGEINGRFTKTSAEDLALTLKSGALPAPIEYQEERTVGPSLGADSIRSGVAASLAGLIFVVIFMLIYYRGSGINAVIALVLNLLLTLAGMIWIGSTLTLPGIAGLILGVGMAVDSNVLIFERMREELRAGKSVAESIALGFDRAFVTIIDTHITTIISSTILYMYGSGPIRGFAVTLVLSLLVNLFSAVFVSRTIFMWLLERNPNMKKISI